LHNNLEFGRDFKRMGRKGYSTGDERLHGQGIQWKDKERRRMIDCMDIGQGILYNGSIRNVKV